MRAGFISFGVASSCMSADIARAVVMDDDGKILVLQNAADDPKDYAREKWEIPGGFVEHHDKDEKEAVKREVREETGLEVEVERPIERVIVKRPDGPDADCQYYLCHPESGEVELSREHMGYDWIAPEDYCEVDWYFYAAYTMPVLARLVEQGY